MDWQLALLAVARQADWQLSFNEALWLSIAWLAAVVAILDFWWLLPKLIRRIFVRLDDRIQLDLAQLAAPVSLVLNIFLTLITLAAAGLMTAALLGFNVDWARDAALRATLGVAAWLGPRMARIALIILLGLLAARAISRFIPPLLRRYLSRRASADTLPSELEKREKTLIVVVVNALSVLVAILVGFIILSELGVNLAPLLATAGVVGIAIGFGAQSLVKDIFSGIFILLEDQYRVGDVVTVADVSGLVEDINLRRTVLRDLDFIQHFVPNGEIRVASNFTKEKSRVNMNVQVAYKEDLDRVIALINRVGQEMSQDAYFGPLIRDPIKVLRVDAFEESGIAIKALGETLPIRQWEVAGEFRRRLKRLFDEEGVEIPFPHRTIYWGAGVETRVRSMVEEAKMGENGETGEKSSERAERR